MRYICFILDLREIIDTQQRTKYAIAIKIRAGIEYRLFLLVNLQDFANIFVINVDDVKCKLNLLE